MALRCLISTSSFGKQSSLGLDKLKEEGFEVTLNPFGRKLRKKETLELYAATDVVIAGVEDLDAEVLQANPQLKVISRCGIGTDSVDMEEAKRLQIPVLITPEPPAQAVAELTLGLVFAAARHVAASDAAIRKDQWKPLMGVQLKGKTLGILGFGRVGQKVARVMKALGMNLMAYDPYPNLAVAQELGVTLGSLEEVLVGCNVVTLHLPLLPSTRGLLGAEKLSMLKPGAIVINTSRGGVLDEAALKEGLDSGRIYAAALDVYEVEPYEGPLRELPNVVLTAHMGSYAAEARLDMELEAAENLIKECRRLGLLPEAKGDKS